MRGSIKIALFIPRLQQWGCGVSTFQVSASTVPLLLSLRIKGTGLLHYTDSAFIDSLCSPYMSSKGEGLGSRITYDLKVRPPTMLPNAYVYSLYVHFRNPQSNAHSPANFEVAAILSFYLPQKPQFLFVLCREGNELIKYNWRSAHENLWIWVFNLQIHPCNIYSKWSQALIIQWFSLRQKNPLTGSALT